MGHPSHGLHPEAGDRRRAVRTDVGFGSYGEPEEDDTMAFRVFRVLPEGEEWAVKEDGSPEPGRRFGTKGEAISWGREEAERNRPSQLVVHAADGSIERGSLGPTGDAP